MSKHFELTNDTTMTNHRDRIEAVISELLATQYMQDRASAALRALSGDFEEQYIQMQERHQGLIRSVRDRKQALLDTVTTDAEHAAKWRELVGQLDMDLDDTEVPDVLDAFYQDAQKGDGEADEQEETERPSFVRTDRPNGDEHPLIFVHRFDSGGVRASYDPPVMAEYHLGSWRRADGLRWSDGLFHVFTKELTEWEVLNEDEGTEDTPALTVADLEAAQSPPDPEEYPLIRIYAFKGEELEKPIDAAWHDELFVSFREESFPNKSNSTYPHRVTRWTPLEAREVSGDD